MAANLLMLVLLLGGWISFSQTTKEVFPEFALDVITVSMSYPGATPEEVEQGIVLPIENAIREVDGLYKITSRASEGSGSVSAEIIDPDESMRITQDIKTAVDRINTFPVDSEDLQISLNNRTRDVMDLALSGTADEHTLRKAAERLQAVLEADPEVGPVELDDVREYEIHIEVSQENLRRYGLTMQGIATRVRKAAIELGGGRLETSGGEILLRMSERRDYARQFDNIPIVTLENGSTVLLGDIATLREGFEDKNISATYEGKKAVLIDVQRIGDQTPGSVAAAVKKHMAEMNATLPGDLRIDVLDDNSKLFAQRADLLINNGIMGFLLVMAFLAVFLDIRLAFWVSMGIPISFLGAFLLFPATGFTINIVSMFAFIIALGIVVDDAIISGENIYHYRQQGYAPKDAAILGAGEVGLPVLVSVLTNMVAFVPLFFIPGFMGKVFGVIPVVVIAVFFISLVESLFILPAHLTFKKARDMEEGRLSRIVRWQKAFNSRFERFVREDYGRVLEALLRSRYIAVAFFLAVLLGLAGYVFSGRMGMELFPRVDADYAFVEARLKVGAPDSEADAVQKHLMESARKVIAENGGDTLATGVYARVKENVADVRVFLTDPEVRPLSTAAFTDLWREETGEIAGLENLSFLSNRGGPGSGAALTVEVAHSNIRTLEEASEQLARALAEFPNVKDIDDGSAQGKKQYEFTMKPLGYTMGLTTEDVARQVRAAFYGSEAMKQQRGRFEVRILVRLPEEERTSEYHLKNLILRTPSGGEVPLQDVVNVEEGRAYTSINRRNGRRVVEVKADVDPPSAAGQVIEALKEGAFPELQQRYPGLDFSFEGHQAELRDSTTSLFWGLLAVLFVMYALLAVLFNSYGQPVMILISIPFSAAGAVLGHFMMGYSLSVMSLFGMMALAGVVVNDSLILIDFANRKVADGEAPYKAITSAAVQRFRPIMLTTLTTFMGLAPMIFETSRQARFLIPMALSLGFGILFATFITLTLIPALFLVIEDIKKSVFRKDNA